MAVDFGFGSFLEKFEEHFGKTAVKWLVGLIGVAVVAVCCGLIWSFIAPIIGWTTETAQGTSLAWIAWKILGFVFGFSFLVAGGVVVASAFDAKRVLATLDDALERVSAAADRVTQLMEEASAAATESRAVLKASEQIDKDAEDRLRVVQEKLAEAEEVLSQAKEQAAKLESEVQGKDKSAARRARSRKSSGS